MSETPPRHQTAALDVSICICTYNRKNSVLEALESLRAMRDPDGASFEVIVVDNNSADGTGAAVRDLMSGDLPLRYVQEERQGLSHARNRAVEEATGRVVAFLDDDVVVDEDWLQKLSEAFSREPPPVVVGGPARLDSDLARPSWWHEEFAGPAGHFDRGDAIRTSDEGYSGMIGIGANMAFDRQVFERYGTFRTDLGRAGRSLAMGEELELLDRLRRNSERLVYDPAVVVHHRPDLGRVSRSYLRRWYFRFGEWSFENERDRRAVKLLGIPRWRFRHFVEDLGRWMKALVRSRRPETLLYQLHLVAFAGYLKRAWLRRSTTR